MTTSSAEAIGNNIDLLTEILFRLPIKPLVRAKCVSKQCLSLISDPQFCLSHNRHHYSPYPETTALMLNIHYTNSLELNIISLKHPTIVHKPPSLDDSNIKILGCCNGLVLYCHWNFVEVEPHYQPPHVDRYFICNPTTKRFKKLSCEFMDSAFSLSLAFDPLKSIHYKVIALRQLNQNNKQCQIYIYSSESDSWSPTEIIFTPPDFLGVHTVFCNGAIHWTSWDLNLLNFDVDRECLNTMSMPISSDDIWYFGESGGHLHLIVKDDDIDFKLKFDVLEMATDYSGWFVRYHVNLDAMRIVFPELFWRGEQEIGSVQSVLCVVQAEKEEESMVVVSMKDRAISFNISDGTSMVLSDLKYKSNVGFNGMVYKVYQAYQCFDTLSCV